MNTFQSLETFSEPRYISIAGIERELQRLWRSAVEADQAILRASSLNLLIFSPSPEDADAVTAMLNDLVARHPGRVVIMVEGERTEEPGLEAWVSAYCLTTGAGRKHLCCEQVIIVAHGDARYDLPSAVIPLVVADLPVVLCWRGKETVESAFPRQEIPEQHSHTSRRGASPFGDQIFDRLARTCDRIIVDSDRFENPTAELVHLAEAVRYYQGQPAITDLNWARLTTWRQLTAQFFDSPDLCAYLPRLNRVTVEYEDTNPAQALLLVGWLGSRLGWEPDTGVSSSAFRVSSLDSASTGPNSKPETRNSELTLRLRSPGHVVEVELRATEPSEDVPCGLASLVLAVEEAPAARFSISCDRQRMYAITSVERDGGSGMRRTVVMESPGEAELMAQELDILGRDRVFEDALDFASQIVRIVIIAINGNGN